MRHKCQALPEGEVWSTLAIFHALTLVEHVVFYLKYTLAIDVTSLLIFSSELWNSHLPKQSSTHVVVVVVPFLIPTRPVLLYAPPWVEHAQHGDGDAVKDVFISHIFTIHNIRYAVPHILIFIWWWC